MEVVIVSWPAERERREELRRGGRPRLLLLEDGAPPPDPDDCLEDWARAPIDEPDLRAPVAAPGGRHNQHGQSAPALGADGVRHHPESWVSHPPVEARLMAALLERSGAVVSRESLARAGWPD